MVDIERKTQNLLDISHKAQHHTHAVPTVVQKGHVHFNINFSDYQLYQHNNNNIMQIRDKSIPNQLLVSHPPSALKLMRAGGIFVK